MQATESSESLLFVILELIRIPTCRSDDFDLRGITEAFGNGNAGNRRNG